MIPDKTTWQCVASAHMIQSGHWNLVGDCGHPIAFLGPTFTGRKTASVCNGTGLNYGAAIYL